MLCTLQTSEYKKRTAENHLPRKGITTGIAMQYPEELVTYFQINED